MDVFEFHKARQYPRSIPLKYDVFYTKKYNDLRRVHVIILSEILTSFAEFNQLHYDHQTELLRLLEKGCYKETIRKAYKHGIMCSWRNEQFQALYQQDFYKIAVNIDPSSSVGQTGLMKRILSQELQPQLLARMSSQDLYPELYVELLKRINIKASVERKVKYTRLYRCHKCKHNMCTMEKLFNRSGDEAINYTITCMFCWNTWNA